MKGILFEEKQYLGFNKYSIFRRMVLAIFCFLAYYFSDDIPNISNSEKTDNIFFFMGILILVMSLILIFVLHIQTKVIDGSIVLDGLWTSRKVKIDLNSIKAVKKIQYSKYLLNRPVYNLHISGKIRFFTRGNEAVELTDKDGLKYIIGSQKAEELVRIISEQIKTN